MNPVKFKESNLVMAEHQKEYLPLPVHRNAQGIVVSCWKMTLWERLRFLISGRVWFTQYTFNTPMQPQLPSIEKPTWAIEEAP